MFLEPSSGSPIEEIVAWALPKYLDPSVEVVREHPILYRRSEFRLDFLLRHQSGFYGLECDGKDYHSHSRDMFRDACILGASGITAIYRITGRDINSHVETALHLVAKDIPLLFTSRGRLNLQTLSEFRDESLIRSYYDCVIASAPEKERSVVVMKLDRSVSDQYWRELFDFAQRFPDSTMEEIGEKYWEQASANNRL